MPRRTSLAVARVERRRIRPGLSRGIGPSNAERRRSAVLPCSTERAADDASTLSLPATPQSAWGALTRSHAAAGSYSWMRPPRRSRRRTVVGKGSPRVDAILRRVGRLKVERAAWTMRVVMPYIDAEDTVEVEPAEDQQSIKALTPDAADPALDVRVRVRRPQRCPDDLIPSPWKTASKARLNFASRSWIRNRGCRPRSSRSISTFRACCIIQVPSGLLVEATYSIRRVPM